MPEKSRNESQVASNSYLDHDRTSCPNTLPMIMSADCWKREEAMKRISQGKQCSNKSTTPLYRAITCVQPSRFGLAFRNRGEMPVGIWSLYLILIASLWVESVPAVSIVFTNCLSEAYQHNQPLQLQFVPLFFDAVFNTTDSSHNLAVKVWGNVAGSGPELPIVPPPGANDTAYWSSNSTDTYNGKIVDEPDNGAEKLTTLSNKVTVLTYEPYNDFVDFCNQLDSPASCPLGPVFNISGNPQDVLPSFGFNNNFYHPYAFTSFSATLVIKNGDEAATPIGCISANITPDIGKGLAGTMQFLPLMVLIFVGGATAFAAIHSPWGTTDTFRWTTNYGRDADLLRLVTPGFGDCLQYIQFVALTGGLSLDYPGFYQPIVSKVSWSTLMFNESFVSNTYRDSLVDGIYVTNGTYGLDRMRQLVGMGEVDDVWAGMAVWLLAIIGVTLVLIQLGLATRWVYRLVMGTQEEDLRKKNLPFSVGNVIRIVFNYFLLPIVALSMFQLVVASRSPAFTTGLAVLMLVVIVVFAFWLLYFIASARPKSYLFDDLPTLLKYGALYNTYSDNAAPFALVPVLLTFVRGIAIGAVQPSGIAQLVLLAICEVITVLTLHAFRPFHSPTSMNAYHTFFAVLRFATILLMIAFAPSLGVTDGPKGWIGYAILLMHAIVLVLGFMLNAVQTIVEVAARLAGAGGDESGAARGGLVKVFGMRQLSRRLPQHRDAASRQSQLSSAAMLSEQDRKSYLVEGGRLRSQSAGSTGILWNRQSGGEVVDAFGAMPAHHVGSGVPSSYTPTTPGEASTSSFLPSAAARSGRNKAPILGLDTTEAADPYYRPPRFRRPTADTYSPGIKSRGSWASGDWTNKQWSQHEPGPADAIEPFDGPSSSGHNSPVQQPPLNETIIDLNRPKADYTTREVDFYYGVRGPALNANTPGRRIKTGPADPTGIPASAVGWFKGLFGGKTKEKGKGFEVVRSSRMPPGMQNMRNTSGQESPPEGIPVATGGIRHGPIDSDSDDGQRSLGPSPSHRSGPPRGDGADDDDDDGEPVSPVDSDGMRSYHDDDEIEMTRISDVPPSLQGLSIPAGGMELPSRFPSKASSRVPHGTRMDDIPSIPSRQPSRKPTVPRKSSRRHSQNVESLVGKDGASGHNPQLSVNSRLPFERSNSTKRHSDISARSSIAAYDGGHSRNSSSFNGHFTEDYGNERPTSVGFVNHHQIHTINPPANQPDLLGSSAELVDGRNSAASSVDRSR